MLSVVISGWPDEYRPAQLRASFAGITLNSVSLIFIVAGGTDLRIRHPRVRGPARNQ